MRAVLVVLFMVCFFRGEAQTYFRSPLYSFTGRIAVGTGNVGDSSAYLTVGPLGPSVKGLRLPRVADTAAISGTKRMGLFIYSTQKGVPSWYDSTAGYWKAFGGETNTMSSAGGTSLYKSKTGVNFDLKGITAGSGVLVTGGTNDVVLKADTSLLATLTDLAAATNYTQPTLRVVDNDHITQLAGDYTIIEKNNTTGKNLTLLSASSYSGKMLYIVNSGIGTLTTSAAYRITSSTTSFTLSATTTYLLQSDGTDWWLITQTAR